MIKSEYRAEGIPSEKTEILNKIQIQNNNNLHPPYTPASDQHIYQ